MMEFEPMDLDRPPTKGDSHFTFRPSAMPSDAYLLVVVPPEGTPAAETMATGFTLTRDPVPPCVDYPVEVLDIQNPGAPGPNPDPATPPSPAPSAPTG